MLYHRPADALSSRDHARSRLQGVRSILSTYKHNILIYLRFCLFNIIRSLGHDLIDDPKGLRFLG
jgi:hypothetical protein